MSHIVAEIVGSNGAPSALEKRPTTKSPHIQPCGISPQIDKGVGAVRIRHCHASQKQQFLRDTRRLQGERARDSYYGPLALFTVTPRKSARIAPPFTTFRQRRPPGTKIRASPV